MKTITTTEELADYCQHASKFRYVTVDTEFLRERTYYAKLCLIQLAVSGDDDEVDAVLVDPLINDEMSLEPLYDLFRDENVVKVFHAARQDLEIFYVEGNVIPHPLFDTQVAAMVCDFGEQVGYETLVRRISKASVDKTSRFTDWSRRPLTDAQMNYAIADVTHLRGIYEYLDERLTRTKRKKWVEEELDVLRTPETYVVSPDSAWKRVKVRTNAPKFLAIVRELAKFRETFAQDRNVPRSRVFKDDAMLELASTKPMSEKDLGKSRLLLREARKGDIAQGILSAVEVGLNCPVDDMPKVSAPRDKSQINAALADLLRVLLKTKAEEFGIAQKLIATASDLDDIAMGERDGLALKGWRGEVFGEDALRLCRGEIALSADGKSVKIITI
jgi:ribonuclease D